MLAEKKFVLKKDETLLISVNYCKLNAVSKQDSCVISRMNKCIDQLGKVTVFSSLDTDSHFCPIKFKDANKGRTAFNRLTSYIALSACPLIYEMPVAQSIVQWT